MIYLDNKPYRAHRVAWTFITGKYPDPKVQIDHKNRIRHDNWAANLEAKTPKENCANRGRNSRNKTGYPGVSLEKRTGKFRAQIMVQGKQKLIGRYSTVEEAHAARVEPEKRYVGASMSAATKGDLGAAISSPDR
jgi:hypothetical protein